MYYLYHVQGLPDYCINYKIGPVNGKCNQFGSNFDIHAACEQQHQEHRGFNSMQTEKMRQTRI